jgi:hypothetical protein
MKILLTDIHTGTALAAFLRGHVKRIGNVPVYTLNISV